MNLRREFAAARCVHAHYQTWMVEGSLQVLEMPLIVMCPGSYSFCCSLSFIVVDEECANVFQLFRGMWEDVGDQTIRGMDSVLAGNNETQKISFGV